MGENRLYSGAYHSPVRTFFILFLINNVKCPILSLSGNEWDIDLSVTIKGRICNIKLKCFSFQSGSFYPIIIPLSIRNDVSYQPQRTISACFLQTSHGYSEVHSRICATSIRFHPIIRPSKIESSHLLSTNICKHPQVDLESRIERAQ